MPAKSMTAVTVTHNSSAVIARLLDSLPEVPVIVVDNGSVDDSRDIAGRYPNVQVIANHNTGYGRGANLGFAQGQTPYMLLVNPDVILSEGAVHAMLACAEAHPEIGIVSARIFHHDADGQKIYTASPEFNANGIAYVDWIVGAVMLIRREVLEKAGRFDENIFLFFEETDLCKRFVNAGYKLAIAQNAEAEHEGGNSSPASLRMLKIKSWHYAWSRAYYYHKHFPRAKFAIKTFTKFFRSTIRMLQAMLRSDAQNTTRNAYEILGALSFMCGLKAFRHGDIGRLT